MKQIFIILSFFITTISSQTYDKSYLIFVGSNYSDYQNLTVYSNFSSIYGTKYFNDSKSSVLIIHGYRDGYNDEFSKSMVNAFLNKTGYNVIIGDWSAYAMSLDYPLVVSQVNGISKTFNQLLSQIKSAGYDLTKIYPIGHSIGAHIAGKIGSLLQSQNVVLPRITGLDPAGPLFVPPTFVNIFGISIISSPGNMLYKGNAKFVDIIHSNAGASGTLNSIGDIDFWPNGGSIQPLCDGCGSITKPLNCTACNHSAAWRYYSESVTSSTSNFTAKRCLGFLYTNLLCNGPATASMGFYANSTSPSGQYFLKTKSSSPYSN